MTEAERKENELTTTEVAERLEVTPATVLEYMRLGWLRGWTRSGEVGPGQRWYFDAREVEAFAKGGRIAAKAWREQQEPTGRPKRGRRVKV